MLHPLHRIDETHWKFQKGSEEFRIVTPGLPDRSSDYALARKIAEYIEEQELIGPSALVDCSGLRPELAKQWQIADATQSYFQNLQKGSIIYRHEFTDLGIRVFEAGPASTWDGVSMFFQRWLPFLQSAPPLRPKWTAPYARGEIEKTFFEKGLFRDPFTELAEKALQSDETPFVSEHRSAGSYRYSLADGKLQLVPSSHPLDPDASRAALGAFREYLRRVFNWHSIRNDAKGLEADLRAYSRAFDDGALPAAEDQLFGYLKETYEIDFDRMMKEGKPLLPDHVYKCNIAVNQIDMAYLESLFLRLDHVLKPALTTSVDRVHFSSVEAFHAFLKEQGIDLYFSLREIWGMYHSFARFSEEKSCSALKRYLATFLFLPLIHRSGQGDDVRKLTPQAFHRLMEMAFAGSELLDDPKTPRAESFFTGRKITHLAISGYKTMGDKSIFDPCRNGAELLHIFPGLRSGDRDSHYELLAHVVAKKALQSCLPSRTIPGEKEWRVGRLIPFSDDKGITQWYYVDGYLNDRRGDVNYVLIPASRGYLAGGCSDPRANVVHEKRAPLIKLYRSTASDAEAESSTDSLLADVNPNKVGSLDFDRGDEYERAYFQRCTMPLWAGYLIHGDVEKAARYFLQIGSDENPPRQDAQGKEECIVSLIAWQKKCPLEEASQLFSSFKKLVGEEALRIFLSQTAQGAEWARENKVAQDIDFVGHSLGAALAQAALYHFGAREDRIPLSGCNFRCFAFDPPGGVTAQESDRFLQFGREHRSLLAALNQRWELHYRFEYQDFVPQGGPTWLGVSEKGDEDADWLQLTGTLYQPLPTARTPEITTAPTHGRRFLHTDPTGEYRIVPLSAQELYDFKHSLWLSLDLRAKFGFLLTTPRLTEELIRKPIGGTLGYSYLWLKKLWSGWASEPRSVIEDPSGVTFFSLDGENFVAESVK
jgi:hypothetical protein